MMDSTSVKNPFLRLQKYIEFFKPYFIRLKNPCLPKDYRSFSNVIFMPKCQNK